MKILAVDPGLANTGIVLLEDGRITNIWKIKSEAWEKPKHAKLTTAEVMDRATVTTFETLSIIQSCEPDHIAIEGYTDYGGGFKRNVTNRWTTPMVIGVLGGTVLEAWRHAPVHYQQPEIVLTSQAAIKKAWGDGVSGLIPGDHLLANDHLRSAALHALHLHYQLKIKEARA